MNAGRTVLAPRKLQTRVVAVAAECRPSGRGGETRGHRQSGTPAALSGDAELQLHREIRRAGQPRFCGALPQDAVAAGPKLQPPREPHPKQRSGEVKRVGAETSLE